MKFGVDGITPSTVDHAENYCVSLILVKSGDELARMSPLEMMSNLCMFSTCE